MVLKVGDKVFVKKTLKHSKYYGKSEVCFVPPMDPYKGELVTISKVIKHENFIRYNISEDSSYWIWVIEMFEINQEEEEELWY